MKPSSLVRSAICAAVAMVIAAPLFAAAPLEEIVVTARKRVENIQDVPLAVSAITGADVEKAFTLDTTSLQSFAPNVVFDTIEMGTPGGGGFSIRGISYQDVDKGFDPTVLVAVDGVPLATGTGEVFDLIDIDRIEILRGPQGTLFGKNVIGGLINIHRIRPQLGQFSGKVRLRGGQYKKYSGDVLLNYGADTWAVKLTGGIARQDKGFIGNETGGSVWTRDEDRFGLDFLWQPSDKFKGEAIVDYSKLGGTPSAVFLTDINTKDLFCSLTTLFDSLGVPPGGVYCSGVPGEPATHDRQTTALNFPTWNKLKKWQLTLRAEANVTDHHTLTYVGSWMNAKDDQQLDGDGTPYPIYEFRRWGDYTQISNELRLARDSGSPFTWTVGVYQEWAEGTNNQNTWEVLLGCGTADIPCLYEFGRTTSSSFSAFGEGDLALLDDKLVLTAGARYINQTKKLARSTFSPPDNAYQLPPNSGGSRNDDKVIYRVGARYHFTNDIMGYVTVSTGFRSGGLSPRAQTAQVLARGYKPEKLTNYEAGLRTTLFNGSLIFNLTGFHMIYKDMQIELAVPSIDENGNLVGTGTQLAIENAGKAEFNGVEMDFEWGIADWWRVQGNAGYLHAKYKKLFVNIWGDQDATGALLPPQDETSLKLRRAPKWNYGITSIMTKNMGKGTLSGRVSWSWTDKYEATITNYPGSAIPATGILEASISYELDDWQLSLFGRNLTNADSWTHSYVVNPIRPTATDPAPGTLWRFAQRRPPREIGVELLYRF